MVTVTQLPGTGADAAGDEQVRGVGDADDAGVTDLEAADLVGRAEAVLGGAHEPQRGVPLAVEGDHHVDQVLERARPGDRAVLGDVADEDRRHAAALGDGAERAGHGADLGGAAVGAVDGGGADRLDAVEDQQRGIDRLDVREDGGELRLRREVEVRVQGADPLGAQPHLRGGLLAGHHEGRPVGRRDAVGDLEQERGLPDPGLTGDQQHGARDQAAAEDPVELLDPGRHRAGTGELDLGDRPGGGGDRTGGHRAQRERRPLRTRRGCPRPGTRGSGRPTWPRRSRTRSSGGTGGRTSLQRAARGDANPGVRQTQAGRDGQPGQPGRPRPPRRPLPGGSRRPRRAPPSPTAWRR